MTSCSKPSLSQRQELSRIEIEKIAAEALHHESLALQKLADSLPKTFFEALQCLLVVKGKVFLSGVGKSGHIARKIASTLSSTGTPACFLHPTEGGHGDLGMLTAEDVLMLFSNSGETVELSPLIRYAQKVSIPLIAVTSVPKSTLSFSSDIVLLIPQASEICPLGLAPTTSTLLMLGLGDALAICLSHMKGFEQKDYRLRHPSGALGRQLLKISDIMRRQEQLPIVSCEELVGNALLVMTQKACGCLGIVDTTSPGKLIGVITDGDLRRYMAPDLLEKQVKEIMSLDPLVVSQELLVTEAIDLMNERRVTLLFVHDSLSQLVGLVHLHDCLRSEIY